MISRRNVLGLSATGAIAHQAGSMKAQRLIPGRYVDFSDFMKPDTGQSASSQLQEALKVAAETNRTLHVPAGRYYLDREVSKTVPAGFTMLGDGPDRTVFEGESDHLLLNLSGGTTQQSEFAITADAAGGSTTIATNAGSFLRSGQWINIQSDRVWSESSGKGARYGEIVRVSSVSTMSIELSSRLKYSYLVTENARLVTMDLAPGFRMEGFGFENSTPATGAHGALYVSRFDRPHLSRIHGSYLDGSLLAVNSCSDAEVEMISGMDFADNEAQGRFGYLVNITGPSRGTHVSRCSATNVRHVVTTNASGNSYFGGVPTDTLISYCIGRGSTNFCFSTHEEGDQTTFLACAAIDSHDGGFETRSPSTKFIDCRVTNTLGIGIYIQKSAIGALVNGFVGQNIGLRLSRRGLPGVGIRIDGPECTVDGFSVDTTGDSAIVIANTVDALIRNGRIRRPGDTNPHGIRLTGRSIGHSVEDVMVDNRGVVGGGSALYALAATEMRSVSISNLRSKGVNDPAVRGIPQIASIPTSPPDLMEFQSDSVGFRRISATSVPATSYDQMIIISDTSAPRTVRLPNASSTVAGHELRIKDESGEAGTKYPITIGTRGENKIDGESSKLISRPYGSVHLYSDGMSKWFTL